MYVTLDPVLAIDTSHLPVHICVLVCLRTIVLLLGLFAIDNDKYNKARINDAKNTETKRMFRKGPKDDCQIIL